MLIFKKENAARNIALDHFAKTHECLLKTRVVLDEYMAGDLQVAQQSAAEVIALESEADKLKSELRIVLFSGAFLPNIRSDVYRLIDAVDAVADVSETVSHFIVDQNPRIPEEFQQELSRVLGVCIECYQELRKALKCFFKPKGEMDLLREHASKVCQLETEVDHLQVALTRKVFESQMELAEKLHLCQLFKYIGRIADRTEDAGDELQFAAMKAVM